jgi:allantoate deiminase
VTGGSCRPERVIADLRELDALTGGPEGARRVAFTAEWRRARAWLRAKLVDIGCPIEVDPAGNLWATVPGERAEFVAVGSHLDSVPAGGWLDGALGVVAALELLRRHAGTRPPLSLRLVDWADEEGARFGASLFGSSAAAGTLDLAEAAHRHDGTESLGEALRACELTLADAPGAQRSLEGLAAYVELHIEQGPVLERNGHSLAVVTGTAGVERRILRLTGEAAHAGAAPMDMRRDPVVVAGRLIADVTDQAAAVAGTATVGSIVAEPGVVTIVPGHCELSLDLRHRDAAVLDELVAFASSRADELAHAAGVGTAWRPQWRIDPIPFDAGLVELAYEAAAAVGETPHVMASGALHDAASMAPLAPTVMLFVPSRGGISHSPAEDTAEEDIVAGVRTLDALVERVLNRPA